MSLDRSVWLGAGLSGCFVVGLLACSGSGASSSSGTAGPSAEDGGTGTTAEGGSAEEPSGGPYNLAIAITVKDASSLAVAVRDAETKELVAFGKEESSPTVTINKPALLLHGHRYEIGIKGGWFASCTAESTDVWYREIPAVEGNVSITASVASGASADARGCVVVHEPVKLPPGTYGTAAPVLGVPGNKVTVVVSPSGRVYSDVRIFCANPACNPTKISGAPCDEDVVYPGQSTFEMGSSGSYTSVKGTATIDAATKTVRYVGRTRTFTASGKDCCDEAFDVALGKVSSSAGQCQ